MSATGEGGSSDRGATLIEMLVVVGIMGLIAGLVFPDFSHAIGSASLSDATERLDGDLRIARADAAREGHATLVERQDARGYASARGVVRLRAPLILAGDARAIQFYADGSSSGGDWTVTNGGRTSRVVVDPVTGVTLPQHP